MSATLIIVESPNKAKKIQGYLGRGFTVKASMGHIANLPPKSYGVDLATLEESYEVRNADVMRTLKTLVKSGGFDRILLASDPDREGEAIAWHLARELKLPLKAANRIEFREITEKAVQAAIAAPRPIDLARIDAQRSRRVLDRIVGFDCSKEICWPAGAQSAGRCQTPALHLLCQREREILAFVPRTYFTVAARYAEGLTAFIPADPKTVAAPTEDTGESEGEAKESAGRLVPRQFESKAEAEAVEAVARAHPHVVSAIERKRTERKPEQPYTTSTLQQDASRKLRMTAKAAMDAAQKLFEAGMITYHRTDSTRVSEDAVAMARAYLAAHHPTALPASAPKSRGKAGAQDAHEAVRPTHLEDEGTPPAGTAELYAMVKARFLASQCGPAVFDKTTIRILNGPVTWVAEGSVLIEPGFLLVWGPYARQDDTVLPALTDRQRLTLDAVTVEKKATTPPGRYDQGGLIKKLEVSGIGRPATFANIIDTLLKRNYVQETAAGRGKQVLQPTAFGLQVDGLMTATFPDLVSEEYTADMEAKLDDIEHAKTTRPSYLRTWYDAFRTKMGQAAPLVTQYCGAHGLKPSRGPGGGEDTGISCDRCGEATYRKIARKTGKGSFLACPACNMMRDVKARVKPKGCLTCGSALIEKKFGAKEPFFGCVRYGAATNPCSFVEGRGGSGGGAYTRAATTKPCPKCGVKTLVLLTPKNDPSGAFYGCDDKETCRFTLPLGAMRRKTKCPECQGAVLERRRRPSDAQKAAGQQGDPFWACARHPDCKYTADWTTTASV